MSQGYSFKFDQMRDNSPADKQEETGEGRSYGQPGHVRNLCFVWPDGRMKFLNYAYLVSGEYSPEESRITLIFTSDTVLIKGIKLEGLFEELVWHLPQKINCTEDRYNGTFEREKPIVNRIEVVPK